MIPDTQDDQFDFNPNQYPDAGRNAVLPLPGEYKIRVTSGKIKTDKDGNVVTNTDASGNTYRTVRFNRIEIVEPTEDNGTFAVFQDVRSKPFKRKGQGGQMFPVSNVMDAIRAIDVELASEPTGWDDAADVLLREITSGATFNVRLGYKVQDIDGAKEDLKGVQEGDTEAVNKAFNDNTFYTKHFRNADGTFNTSVKSKDGQRTLEAKLVIDAYVASNKQGQLGAFGRK